MRKKDFLIKIQIFDPLRLPQFWQIFWQIWHVAGLVAVCWPNFEEIWSWERKKNKKNEKKEKKKEKTAVATCPFLLRKRSIIIYRFYCNCNIVFTFLPIKHNHKMVLFCFFKLKLATNICLVIFRNYF